MEEQNEPKTRLPFFIFFLMIAFLSIAGFTFIKFKTPTQPVSEKISFEKFASEEELTAYLKKTAGVARGFFGLAPLGLPRVGLGEIGTMEMLAPEGRGAEPERVSETTVQVKGIDEPDIVKTDGQEIYFSSDSPVYRLMTESVSPLREGIIPPSQQNKTKVIKAFPLAELAKETEIDKTGNLLLKDNTLVILTNQNRLYGYDVSDPKAPTKKWQLELENNNFLVDARLYQNKIYFITQTRINTIKPCPIKPFLGEDISIKCTDIYRPSVDVPVDVTYTAFILNPDTGKIDEKVSFVGSSGQSVLYMSPNALYATYTYYQDMIDFLYRFFLEKGQDLVPTSMIEKLKTLKGYDISSQAKMVEFQNLYEQYLASLNSNERLRIENEFTNRMEDYSQEHIRELEKTGLVKIDLDKLEVLATGNIPGRPLNQFSLDEYQNHLRVATTVGQGMFGTSESANDVYVLDSRLQSVGSVINLGLGERIYSARFIEDKGYLVTFKQIDPFFVLDLSNPKQPQVKGELKIPGYSSYLHPITKDKILGIGKEGSQVKVSLFNVASPENPTEISKYMLDESWSDILNTHHAFLLDKKHDIFFLPGSRGGYVFSYQNNQFKLTKAVADIQARRAIYINDYLYIIGDNQLVVLNEINWEEVNKLEY